MAVESTKLVEMPEWFGTLETAQGIASKAGSFMLNVSKCLYGSAHEVTKSLNITKFIGGLGAVFAVPHLINNVHNAEKADNTVDKVHYVAQSILSGVAIYGAGASILSGLQSFGMIAKESLSWMSPISMILYPLEFLSLGSGLHKLYRTTEIKLGLNEQAPKAKKTDSLEGRVTNLTKACKYVAENQKSLQKTLNIGKNADLSGKVDRISQKILSTNEEEKKQAVEEGEAMMKTLRTRINTVLTLNTVTTIMKVAKVILAGVVLFSAATPAAPFVAVAATLIFIAFGAFESIMLNDNPFSPSKETFCEKVAYQIRESVHSAAKCVYKTGKVAYRKTQEFVEDMARAGEQAFGKLAFAAVAA